MTAGPNQLVLNLPHRHAYGAEDFFVSMSNASAVAHIDKWPDWTYSGLVIAGPQGCGKSHLANVWRLKSGASIELAAQLDEHLLSGRVRGNGVVIEDIDRGISDERVLFHILNLARETKFSVLITSRMAPADLGISLPDLRSRLKAFPMAVISPPDENVLRAMLVKLFHDRQLLVEPHVVSYLSMRMERSMDAASRLVGEIDSLSLAHQRKITRAVAAEALAGLGWNRDQP